MDGSARRERRQRQPKPGTRAIREWMAAEMERRGWNDALAAEACSASGSPARVSDSTIFNYKHGYEVISRAKMGAIAFGFEIPIQKLVEKIGLTDDREERARTVEDVLVEIERLTRQAREMMRSAPMTG